MNDTDEKLKQLKLSGIRKTLESRNAYALKNQMSYLEFLELLLEDETNNRRQNSYSRKYHQSKLDLTKDLNSFDFAYQPELDVKLVRDLASCRFIQEKKNIVLMGKPGVGKSHIANAIGLEALGLGFKVGFVDVNTLMDRLFASRSDGTYFQLMRGSMDPDLLILDEIGFKQIDRTNVHDFFDIIRKRYEEGSVIITTNRNFEDWGQIFGDPVLASAIIDRILHHATVIRIPGDSYRMKEYLENREDKRLTKKIS